MYEHFLQSDGEFFGDSGVIAKMDCLPIQGNTRVKSDCKLTFEYWKQYKRQVYFSFDFNAKMCCPSQCGFMSP